MYRSKKQQGLSNVLSRRSNFLPKAKEEAYDLQRIISLKLKCFHLRRIHVSIPIDSSFLYQAQISTSKDLLFLDTQQCLRDGSKDPSKFKVEDELLYFEEHLYILDEPLSLQILQAHQDLPTIGHFGLNKTLELISRDFWWPQMWRTIKQFFFSCNICSQSKKSRH